jgi:hypothetical protein
LNISIQTEATMIDLVAAIGGGLFVLASILIGARITWMGFRSGELPELAIGAGLLLTGGLGYPTLMAAQFLPNASDDLRSGLLVAHMLCNIVGLGSLVVFTQQVFRPGVIWARVFAVGIVSSELAFAGSQLAGAGALDFVLTLEGPWHLNEWIGLTVLAWAGTESVLYWRQLKRRSALGLSEPVVVNRIFLWGLSMLSAAMISTLNLSLQALGFQVNGTVAGALVVGPLGLVVAGALFLAFMPPRSYIEWLTVHEAAGVA